MFQIKVRIVRSCDNVMDSEHDTKGKRVLVVDEVIAFD